MKKKPLQREQRWVEEKGEGVPGFGHGDMGIRTTMTKRIFFLTIIRINETYVRTSLPSYNPW